MNTPLAPESSRAAPKVPASPLGFLGVLRRLPRFLRLRCPHCQAFPLMGSLTRFHDTCGHCGYRFIVEEGDFWGGVVFSYTFAGIIGIGTGALLSLGGWFTWDVNIYLAAGTAGLSIPIHYPWAKGAWVHLLYLTRGQYADYAPPDMKDSAVN